MPTLPGHRPPVILEMDLTHPPVPRDANDPLSRVESRGRPRLTSLLRTLHEASADPRVVALIVKVGGPLPWATMQELRLGVRAFAASGKPTLAFAESFGEGSGDMTAYALAAACDELWLQPSGQLGMLGVAVETTFARGALDRLGIEPELEQRHEFKNAADRIMRSEFTPAHRASLERLSESIFSDAVEMIASGRHLAPAEVRSLVDTGPWLAEQAREVGLVDHVGYRDEVHAALRARVGAEAELLFAERWQRSRRPPLPSRRPPHVALVDVRGTIVSGRSRGGAAGHLAGSDSVGAALRAAAADDHARAVLLHIDSPGGSAVASDTIWREVARVRDSGKPVVVSMGAVAASGGYYIACPADVIVALPATITGSIGVFGGKLVTRALLDRLGLTTGTVSRGARSLMYSARQSFADDERESLAASLDWIYADFVAKVAHGRHLSADAVEQLARGRVWTGRDAREHGLVDELGGLHDAIVIARQKARLATDAPVRPAVHVAPLARLGRPRNSDDPRAAMATALRVTDLAASLGLPPASELRMPPLTVR